MSAIEEEVCPIWIAVSTHPNREPTAQHHLRNQCYEVYPLRTTAMMVVAAIAAGCLVSPVARKSTFVA